MAPKTHGKYTRKNGMQTKQLVIAAAGKLEMWGGGCQVPAEPETSTSHTQPLDLVGTQPGTTSEASWQQRFSTGELPNCGAAEFQEGRQPCNSALRRSSISAPTDNSAIQLLWRNLWFSTADSSALSIVG